MKYILILTSALPTLLAQTGTATIAGTLLDAQTRKPVPAALVLASRAGAPPFTRNTRSGADGAFQIQGLAAGNYSLCVQAASDQYLDPCQWNGSPVNVTVSSGRNAAGLALKLAPASLLEVQVQDTQKLLSQPAKDGRRPDLTLGVWGPRGLYYPARLASSPSAAAPPPGEIPTYLYRLAVPRDTALKLSIASRDLRLGDANGLPLPTNTSQQAFQPAAGDTNPKSFTFSVLGLLP